MNIVVRYLVFMSYLVSNNYSYSIIIICLLSVMVNALDYQLEMSEFKLQTNYYVHFWTNKLETLVEDDTQVPFSIAKSPKCRGGCYSIP